MMRALKSVFPAFVTWCKSGKILKASSCLEPCIPRQLDAPVHERDDPYYPVCNPWKLENENEDGT
jgi:hypothetical protein